MGNLNNKLSITLNRLKVGDDGMVVYQVQIRSTNGRYVSPTVIETFTVKHDAQSLCHRLQMMDPKLRHKYSVYDKIMNQQVDVLATDKCEFVVQTRHAYPKVHSISSQAYPK